MSDHRDAVAVEISLLGPPLVERDGKPVAFETRKATALLAHLLISERPRSREALCGLLWPAHDPEHARGALRRTLSTLRKAVGDELIETSGDSIGLAPQPVVDFDVARFRALSREGASREELAEAVGLFRGDFLEGFGLRDSPEFDAWQVTEGEALSRELAGALRRLVEMLEAEHDFDAANPLARRWLELDPLHEPAHRE